MYTLYYGLLNIIKCSINVQLIPCNSSPVSASFKVIYLDNVQSASVTLFWLFCHEFNIYLMPSDVFFKCDDLYTANQAVYTASEFTISSFPLPQSLSLSSLVIKPRPLIL